MATAPPQIASPTAAAGGGIVSVVGQSVVGKFITTPWLPGHSWEIVQGYGATANTYPKDHGTTHWHSGVDIGAQTNTHVVFPQGAGQQATAVYLDNPDGYGTALILRMWTQSYAGHAGGTAQVRNVDIYFGHLSARLVKDGQTVRAGDTLGLTGSTGHSTGPHLHFEVRPPDGKYGTDYDPSQWLLQGNAALQQIQIPNPLDAIGSAITSAEQDFVRTLIGLGQTALGGTMLLAGGATMAFGLRGVSGQQAIRASRQTATQLNRRRIERRPQSVPVPGTPAERSRLRPTLQREVNRSGPAKPASLPLSSLSGPVSGGEERAVLQAEQAATGRRAAPGAAIRARSRYGALGRARLAS